MQHAVLARVFTVAKPPPKKQSCLATGGKTLHLFEERGGQVGAEACASGHHEYKIGTT